MLWSVPSYQQQHTLSDITVSVTLQQTDLWCLLMKLNMAQTLIINGCVLFYFVSEHHSMWNASL